MPLLQILYDVNTLTPASAFVLVVSLITLTADPQFARNTQQLVCRATFSYRVATLWYLPKPRATLHCQILPTVPWILEQLLTSISLSDVIAITLGRVAQWNLSKYRVCSAAH
jgi:hypothetical protein